MPSPHAGRAMSSKLENPLGKPFEKVAVRPLQVRNGGRRVTASASASTVAQRPDRRGPGRGPEASRRRVHELGQEGGPSRSERVRKVARMVPAFESTSVCRVSGASVFWQNNRKNVRAGRHRDSGKASRKESSRPPREAVGRRMFDRRSRRGDAQVRTEAATGSGRDRRKPRPVCAHPDRAVVAPIVKPVAIVPAGSSVPIPVGEHAVGMKAPQMVRGHQKPTVPGSPHSANRR